jgi:hypothetical protein
MEDLGITHEPVATELEAAKLIDALVLARHAQLVKSLSDLGLIQPLAGQETGFQISPRITRKSPDNSLWEVKYDSKVDPDNLPFPFDQPSAALWAEPDGRFIIHYGEDEQETEIEINPTGSLSDTPTVSISRGKSNNTLFATPTRYFEGMSGFKYSEGNIKKTTYSSHVWTREKVDRLPRIVDKPRSTSPRIISALGSKEAEKAKQRRLYELTEHGEFVEAIPTVSNEPAILESFTTSEAWQLIASLAASLEDSASASNK